MSKYDPNCKYCINEFKENKFENEKLHKDSMSNPIETSLFSYHLDFHTKLWHDTNENDHSD